MRNGQRHFYIQCCEAWVKLRELDFSADGKLDYYCHKHPPEVITQYVSWREGLTDREFDDRKKRDGL